jgi:hypothetical protein
MTELKKNKNYERWIVKIKILMVELKIAINFRGVKYYFSLKTQTHSSILSNNFIHFSLTKNLILNLKYFSIFTAHHKLIYPLSFI